MTSGPKFFPKIVKLTELSENFIFFKENNRKFAAVKKKQVLKKRLWRRCFPVNFVKYLRTHFLQNTYGRMLLYAKTSLTEKRNSY